MITLLRQLVLIALAAAFSWWFFLGEASFAITPPLPDREPPTIEVSVVPRVAPAADPATEQAESEPAPLPVPEEAPTESELAAAEPEPTEPEPTESDVAAAESETAPPPPELGDPEGEGDVAAVEARTAPEEELGEPARRGAEDLMQDETFLEDARREYEGEARRGFATVLESSPDEQLEIARFFGEELVLVPRAALDSANDAAHHFRLGAGGEVETIAGLPPLDQYHQYRDLFHYEYAKMPAPLRELRRSVLSRNEIYLFAALVPLAEWALVVGRRAEALEHSGREAGDVRRFVLEYVRRSQGGFDLRVEEIVFTDGSRHVPASLPQKMKTP